MTPVRRLSLAFAAARGGFGLGLIAAPARVASGWLGGDAQRAPTQIVIRGLGARDLALAGGTAAAVLGGGSLRPWLIASAVCDLADIGTTLVAGADSLPDRSLPGTIALAGCSALAGAALAAAAER